MAPLYHLSPPLSIYLPIFSISFSFFHLHFIEIGRKIIKILFPSSLYIFKRFVCVCVCECVCQCVGKEFKYAILSLLLAQIFIFCFSNTICFLLKIRKICSFSATMHSYKSFFEKKIKISIKLSVYFKENLVFWEMLTPVCKTKTITSIGWKVV